ncbi:MAG: PKD domain-containing protein [Thermoplasmata archaeon]
MTYDVKDRYVVLFGGYDAAAYPLNETWTFANGQWTNITQSAGPAPSARGGMLMTYDSADGYVLAFGGSTFTTCSPSGSYGCADTWKFSGGKWQQLQATPPTPNVGGSYNEGFTMAYDSADSYVVMTDGFDTWKWSDGNWTPFCGTNCTNFIPGPDLLGSVTTDPIDNYLLFYGSGYTWKFDGGTWTNISDTTGTAPPAGIPFLLTYDSTTSSVLFLGGAGGEGYNESTWSFNNGTWHSLVTSLSPPARGNAGVADDAADAMVLLFGGASGGGTDSNLNDTWGWGASPPIGELALSVSPSVPRPGVAASFNVSFTGGVPLFSYAWNFGDGTTSTLASPTHAYSSVGYDSVQVWINDSAGHSAHASLTLHVYTPLTLSSIQASPDPAILGQPVNFSALATGGTPPYTYSWSFGDGGTGGNLSNITHIYTTNGPFLASVTVVDHVGGMATAEVNISIKLEAIAGLTTVSQAAPFTVNFLGQAQGGVPPYSFSWSFGDGTANSSFQDPVHTYASSGAYDAVLTVVDGKGNRSSSSLVVYLEPAQTSLGGSGGTSWYEEFLIAAVIAVALAVAWVIDRGRRRARRIEGTQWIQELTADSPPKVKPPSQ